VREKLNKNPLAQVAVIAVLIGAAAFLLLKGGGGEGGASPTSTVAVAPTSGTAATAGGTSPASATSAGAATTAAATATAATGSEAGSPTEAASALPVSIPAPPLPARVAAAYKANKIVVLLIVRKGGIDDRYTKFSALLYKDVSNLPSTALPRSLAKALPHIAMFVVPVRQISRYAAITVGVDVQSVPALVVVPPRHLNGRAAPQASVSYGFQTPLNVVQAVREAIYKGPEISYHPN
jgi:hypothetical protein